VIPLTINFRGDIKILMTTHIAAGLETNQSIDQGSYLKEMGCHVV
jgi:hypothetical protein